MSGDIVEAVTAAVVVVAASVAVTVEVAGKSSHPNHACRRVRFVEDLLAYAIHLNI